MTFKEKYGDHSTDIYIGDFNCSSKDLTSLEGCYKEIHGSFDCSSNELTSLRYSPKEVHGDFDCSSNELTSLKGASNVIIGNFYCSNNRIYTINYLPYIIFYKFISDFSTDEVIKAYTRLNRHALLIYI